MNIVEPIQITYDDLVEDFWEIFHRQVKVNFNKTLFIAKDQMLRSGEANARANVIYNHLLNQKFDSSDGVAIALDDQFKVIPSLLGTWKSKKHLVCLNFSNPAERLKFQLKDAETNVIITDNNRIRLIEEIAPKGSKIINFDLLDFNQDIPNPEVIIELDDLVQIVYTSGSTGNPKGVVEDYQYLIRALNRKINDISATDRLCLLKGFSFPGPHTSLLGAFITGVPICYYDLQIEGIVGLKKWIWESEVTNFSLTPTLFRNFLQTLSPEEKFPSVQTVGLGAEKKLREDFEKLKYHFNSDAVFRLGFASTETMSATTKHFSLNHEFKTDILPAGLPRENINLFIWDENQKEVPIGEEGEIVVRGDALARGYWNLPKLTKERFIPDNSYPRMQYYRSGDLGKILPDGQLMHLGRLDHMVKIKGIRIELESIENHTLSYPGITSVASKAFTDQKGIQRLVTYYIAEKGITIPISDLRMHLQERISSQMMPHFFVRMDDFPKTGSGKTSVKDLPLPDLFRPSLSNAYVPPNTLIEKQLVDIWEDYIGIQGIGITDDFFDLGGDSLIASLLILEIENKLNESFPVSFLIKASTIKKQADLITSDDKSDLNKALITVRKGRNLPPLFFVPGKGGHPTRIINLMQKLTDDLPIYAYQEGRKFDRPINKDEFEEKINYYISQIRDIKSSGPYFFLGESGGGKYVYEIARRLVEEGEEVPFVALLDSYNFGNSEGTSMVKMPLPKHLLGLFNKHVTIITKSDTKGRIDYFKYYSSEFFNRIGWLFKMIGRRFYRMINKKTKIKVDLKRAEKVNARIIFEPKDYSGRVILFKAMKGQHKDELTNGWDNVSLGELIIHKLNCYHGGVLFEPAVSEIGAKLTDYIDEFINSQ